MTPRRGCPTRDVATTVYAKLSGLLMDEGGFCLLVRVLNLIWFHTEQQLLTTGLLELNLGEAAPTGGWWSPSQDPSSLMLLRVSVSLNSSQ